MYGDLADKLIAEARRSENLEQIPLYQTDIVRAVCRETRQLSALEDQALATAGSDRTKLATAGVYGLCQRRNKRCLLAYHRQRLLKLQKKAWHEQDSFETSNLSPSEQVFVREFNEVLVNVKDMFEDIDLTGSMDPPREMYVEVRCLQDAGEIQTEYGVFDLSKNSQFYVRQSDVHRLVQQKLVELVKK
ncbi:DNA replication protein [Starmerella bacillaris]|uniref:DNA replication complex GINS protein PSF1 n=1 Tax=Starmerella bacillaris TaxID=1247836 RepID=A0AAV5RJ73_STABA|nr:DNA replication protein [Starmerella bacillaris]